jgi:hypothetical protein
MKYRKQDENGDMVFGNSLLDFYINSPEAVAQSVETRLKLWLGEWFVDVSEGTEYRENVLGVGKSKSADLTIRRRILETDGVLEIISFDSNIDEDSRGLTIRASINTIYGVSNFGVTI